MLTRRESVFNSSVLYNGFAAAADLVQAAFMMHSGSRVPGNFSISLLHLLAAALFLWTPAAWGKTVRLDNGAVAIGFDAEHGSVVEFRDRRNGTNLVSATGPAAPLWTLDFQTAGKRSVTPSDAGAFASERISASGDGFTPGAKVGEALRLTWEHFAAPLPPEFRVVVTVSLERGQPVSLWGMQLRGLAQAPDAVHFPRLSNLTALTNEMLAVPEWLGKVTGEARRQLASEGSPRRWEWSYPGLLAVQCAAYYSQDGPGLYLAADDAAALRKSFVFFGDGQGNLGCEFVHPPQAGSVRGGEWTLPYRAVLGTFTGDWITAAERYRAWGTNQVWARESRLQRGEVADWVLKTGLWEWNRGRSPGVIPGALALQEKLGLPVSVFWHWWHGCSYDAGFPEYLPPREGAESFANALSLAHSNGIHAIVYMNQRLWGTTTKSWADEKAERFAVKDRGGKTFTEVYNTFTKQPCASMCMGTEFWRNTYAGIAARAVGELGADGIYMDQACASLVCYDAGHAHLPGLGTYWMDGFRALTTDMRARCARIPGRAAVPPVLGGEGCGEAWLPWLDLMLCLQVSKERYSGPEGWHPIPFFQAVYHPYAVSYGNYSSLTMPPYDDLWPAEFAPKEPLKLLDQKYGKQFMREQARAFVWGQQPTIANFLPNQFAERPIETGYMLRLARIRSGAMKYLLRGTFLRAPAFAAPEAELDMSRLSIYAGQNGGLTSFKQQSPLVLAGAWRAPDGDVAIAIASFADEPVALSFILDAGYYRLPKGAVPARIDENGRTVLQAKFKPNQPVRVSLAPRDACVLEFARPR
jgi:hypothetical protein